MITANNVIRALNSIRCPFVLYEEDIHLAISRCLAEAGLAPIHEAKLGPGCRIDFLCESIGIEIKKGRPSSKMLIKQLERYAPFPQISALIVITQRKILLPERICGKPVYVICLNALWGVALP